MIDVKNILYFGIYRPTAPRDKVYLEGLKKRGIQIVECIDNSPGLLKFFRLAKKLRALKNQYDILWVGYLSTMVVPLAWLLSRKRIIFNALDSWYDRSVLDRGMYLRFSPKAILIWIFDFLAFHLAHSVLVESEQQKIFISKTFFVSRVKLKVVFTGVDEAIFHPDSSVKKSEKFTVVFRGMFLPATGVEFVLEVARLLKNEPIDFIVIGWGPLLLKVRNLITENGLVNVRLQTEFLEPKALRELMLSCHIMLGQFGNHPRLGRTIQHKTSEALALGMPYVTVDTPSNLEILENRENCVFISPTEPQAPTIARIIVDLKNRPDFRERLSKGAAKTYRRKLTSEVLGRRIVSVLENL